MPYLTTALALHYGGIYLSINEFADFTHQESPFWSLLVCPRLYKLKYDGYKDNFCRRKEVKQSMDEQMGPSNPSGSLGASTGVTPPSVPASPVFPPTQTTSPIGLPSEPPIQVPAAPIPPVSPPVPATQPQETISLRYVGFGRRFVALIIDVIILTIVGTLLFGGLVLVFVGDLQKLGEGGLVGLSFVSNLVMTLINWIYFVGFLASQGATPGKMALGIKVVTVNGEPVSIGRAILREIIGKIIAVLLLGLGYLWVIWDEKKQGWHDKIAGTVVVYK